MIERNFYVSNEIKSLYNEIIPAYQSAFAGEPWYEVSKCADQFQRCVGGLSSLAVGTYCELCSSRPTRPAYEADELVKRFEAIATSRPSAWYLERSDAGLTLAAIAWEASPSLIAEEKYPDVPGMKAWLDETLGPEPFIWLDEVFANKTLSNKGNLRNFRDMCKDLAAIIDKQTVAYRTINPAMTRVADRDFGDRAKIFSRTVDVPDRRDFVVIDCEI